MKLMGLKYKNFTVEDFVLDKDFRRWILHPTKSSNLFWEKWISENQARTSDLKTAREILLRLSKIRYVPTEEDECEVWEKLSSSLSRASDCSPVIPIGPIGPDTILNKHLTKKRRSFTSLFYGVAASAALIIMSIALFHYFEPRSVDDTLQKGMVSKSNPRGQKSIVFLPDGTKVHLNAESELTYDSDYNLSDRVIHLRGEAFFEVAEDTLRRFTVETEHLSTTALGTSFNVSAYPKQAAEVSLMTGEVKVLQNQKGTEIFLVPGERAYYSTTGTLVKESFELKEHALWRHQVLSFDDTPFEEALNAMERWYDVDFEVHGLPSGLICTGKFENEYLSNVLASMGFTLQFTYQIEGKTVKINFTQ